MASALCWVSSGAAQEQQADAGVPDASAEPASEPTPVADTPSLTPPTWLEPGQPGWPANLEAGSTPVDVIVRVSLDAEGLVTHAEAVKAHELPPGFADEAVRFVRSQQFSPATRQGSPIAARIELRVHFTPPPAAAPVEVAAPPVAAPEVPSPAVPVEATDSSNLTAQDQDEDDSGEAEGGDYGASAELEAGAGDAHAVAASDMRIEVGALHDVPRQDAMQLLTLAPGVVLTNHAGEGHAYAVFMRGFDAAEGQDIEIRVAGIPINEPSNAHQHGYADTHFVIPELVRSVHVREGPFDVRQGDFAAAGSADFELAAREPGIWAQAGMGSYGRRRLLLMWSPSQATRETFAAVDLTDGDGFGPNRAHANVRAMGQLAGRTGSLRYRVLLLSHALRFDSVGVVREDAVKQDEVQCGGADVDPFYCYLDPNQGGQASRHLASVQLGAELPDAEWSQQLTLMFRNNRFREDFTGMLLDELGDGVDQQTATTTLVVGGHYRVRMRPRLREQVLELGYEGRYDAGSSRIWRVRRDDQVPYQVVFDNELGLTRVSVYALGELSLASWLGLELGARTDTYGYDITDRDLPVQDREGERLPVQSVSAWGTNFQPRTTLSVGPFRGLSWVSSFGIGSRSSDAASLSEGEDAPFTRIWSGETGLVHDAHWGDISSDARAAFFYAHVDRDLLFDETRSRNVPIGATNRFGSYAHLRVGWDERLDASTSFTWAEAYQASDGVSAGFNTGPRLPFVPRFVVRGDFAYTESVQTRDEPVRLRGGLGVSWVGPRPLPLDTFSRAIFTLDAAVRARFRFIEVAVEATNLTNRHNRSAEYFYTSNFGTSGPIARRVRHFSAAPPRRVMLNLALIFDPVRATQEKP